MPLFVPPVVQAIQQSFQMGLSGASAQPIGPGVTTEQSILPTTIAGSRSVPANWLKPGRTIRIILNGTYAQPTIAGTITVRVKLGGVTVATGVASSLLSLATKSGFRLSCTIAAPSAGAAIPLLAAGTFDYQAAAFTRQFLDVASTQPVVDGTKALDIDVTAQMSVTGQSLQTLTATVEFLSAQTLS